MHGAASWKGAYRQLAKKQQVCCARVSEGNESHRRCRLEATVARRRRRLFFSAAASGHFAPETPTSCHDRAPAAF